MKVTWLAEVPSEKHVPVRAAYYDYVISKDKLEKDEDWKNYINRNSIVRTFPKPDPKSVIV